MASLGKLTAAFISGQQELSVGLANLNFDFSLIKLEAPAAYHGVGTALSTQRRNIAESGSPHVTARKLGALFEAVLPKTPKLMEAYGERSSEIAKFDTMQSNVNELKGIFADYTGPDATSLWAAATSGQPAMAVHLLACMLARIWPATDATSIWVELVDARKQEISKLIEQNSSDFALFLAGQCILSREQLAEWDNSARAWLRRADDIKKKQQTQLILICSNLNIPVSVKPDTYNNVIEGWQTALIGMESLLSGQSQRVQDGGLLLALSSWHLFPDMIVLGDQFVKQNDDLFPLGSKVILALESSPGQEGQGIYWCLSLSHIRYYGDPEEMTHNLHLRSARLTIDQLAYVALGSIFAGWGTEGRDMTKASKLIYQLHLRAFEDPSTGDHPFKAPNWLRMLAESASNLIRSRSDERDLIMKLVNLGRGKAQSFIAEKNKHPPPLFGLSDYSTFVNFLEETEDQISLLRRAAMRYFPDARPWDVIIQYNPKSGTEAQKQAELSGKGKNKSTSTMAYTTAVPIVRGSPRSDRKYSKPSDLYHQRWIAGGEANSKIEARPNAFNNMNLQEDVLPFPTAMEAVKPTSLIWNFVEDGNPFFKDLYNDPNSSASKKTVVPTASTENPTPAKSSAAGKPAESGKAQDIASTVSSPPVPPQKGLVGTFMRYSSAYKKHSKGSKDKEQSAPVTIDQKPEDTTSRLPEITVGQELSEQEAPPKPTVSRNPLESMQYEMFLGSLYTGAIFVAQRLLYRKDDPDRPLLERQFDQVKFASAEEMEMSFSKGLISPSKLAQAVKSTISSAPSSGYQDYAVSLAGLGWAEIAYRGLGMATINPNVTTKPLHAAKWLGLHETNSYKDISGQGIKKDLTREETFACIAFFESGLDIDPSTFKNVMALSSGDSIYVAGRLLCDPMDQPPPSLVRRVIGNVGKPGLALLVPPAKPLCLQPKAEDWKIINQEYYHGKLSDSFAGTSLHLSFTDWRIPIDVGQAGQGRRDVEAYIYETLVSVHDHGKWIADLDVLDAFSKGCAVQSREWYYKVGCKHEPANPDPLPTELGEQLLTINSWDEFLDHPTSPAIVMAHNNWRARLAVAALAVRRHDRVIVNNHMCWECYEELERQGGSDFIQKAVFIC